jgi:hypothetical protein
MWRKSHGSFFEGIHLLKAEAEKRIDDILIWVWGKEIDY